METLTIQYSCSKYEKTAAILSSTFLFGLSLYNIITEAIAKNYNILFFVAAIGVLLGLLVFFIFSWWQPRPILEINNQNIQVNLPKIKKQNIDWSAIKKVAIGGGHVKITTNSELFLDLAALKHSDINLVKSKIIEICDTKGIPFQND